ncbi:hypothetical protein CKAH01_11545 [Colletotrichum kahawae]|uniref:MADS-box domain-containing protein n=1 Tax=Colletotrichum kahawae TaxID=34407 RepID=A0AAD9YWS2_COLKA|nr:hypothetical protein CKAH01_11545 [Colletotrichum kahawae]
MTQNPSRCFKTRKDGLISKAHVLHTLVPDAKVAFFACYEGKLFSYQSHEDWPVDPFSVEDVEAAPDDQKLPDHFATISVDRTSRNGSDSSLDLESYDDEVPFLDLEYQQHPEVPTPSRLPSIRPPSATPRSVLAGSSRQMRPETGSPPPRHSSPTGRLASPPQSQSMPLGRLGSPRRARTPIPSSSRPAARGQMTPKLLPTSTRPSGVTKTPPKNRVTVHYGNRERAPRYWQ